MLKLYLFIKIRRYKTLSKALKYLKENEEEAVSLGFFKGIDNKIVLPNYRTVSDFFNKKLDKETIEELNSIIETFTPEPPKVTKSSKADKRKKAREVTRLVKDLVYPLIKIRQHHNTSFTTRDFLDVLVHVAYTHDFAHNGAETFMEQNNAEDSPSSHVMLYHFKKFKSMEDVKVMFKEVFDTIFNFGKKNYSLLRRRQADIAYDIDRLIKLGVEI